MTTAQQIISIEASNSYTLGRLEKLSVETK